MKTKKIMALLLALALALLSVGCSRSANIQDTSSRTASKAGSSPKVTNTVSTAYPDKSYGFQTELPENGEEIAILHTSMGDVYIRLFPEAAPKTVENFKTHIKNGYYNGLLFHRVINNFMIQSGDPNGNGTGGESIWGQKFEDEFDSKLLNLRGSLAMANSGENTNGSQFFINQAPASAFGSRKNYDYDTMAAKYKALYDQYCVSVANFKSVYPTLDDYLVKAAGFAVKSYLVPDEVWELYEGLGGNISLDGAWRQNGGHTVFGQVFRGMDAVDAIAAAETDDNDKPLSPVTIVSAEIAIYTAEQ